MDAKETDRAPSQDLDTLLLPFLEANTEEEEPLLVQLLEEHVNPVVRAILLHRLRVFSSGRDGVYRSQDMEEAFDEIQLHLLKRLRSCKSQPENNAVANLRGYVAITARNACDEYFRRKFPQRRNLRDKIRYCLATRSDLSLWEESGKGWLTGLATWKTDHRVTLPAVKVSSSAELVELMPDRLAGVNLQRLALPELLTAILEVLQSPVELDQLTTIVAKLRGIEDTRAVSLDGYSDPLLQRLASSEASAATVVEHHQLLQRLWEEIKRLPRRQRVALLCNLKNQQEVNLITLFPVTGVATFEQLANALEIPVLEFETLWARLPLDDLSLADYLGTTRQQVINLRRSARDRLMRRLKVPQEAP